jgi:hypothetical protein
MIRIHPPSTLTADSDTAAVIAFILDDVEQQLLLRSQFIAFHCPDHSQSTISKEYYSFWTITEAMTPNNDLTINLIR